MNASPGSTGTVTSGESGEIKWVAGITIVPLRCPSEASWTSRLKMNTFTSPWCIWMVGVPAVGVQVSVTDTTVPIGLDVGEIPNVGPSAEPATPRVSAAPE